MSWFADRVRERDNILTLTGAYDALSAKLVAAECEAVYCGGFAATASQHGLPDLGLLGMGEMANIYRRIALAIGQTPLIVDGDGGHGGLLNVQRTVETFFELGVDALHIEDQVLPKRCGHLAGKEVVSRQEAVARIRAAVASCDSRGPAIIARTDAIAVHGFDDAIDRSKAFLDAGASCVFIDAPTCPDQVEAIPTKVGGPVVFNAAPTGVGPQYSAQALQDFGYACVIHPIELLLASANAVEDEIRALRGQSGRCTPTDFNEINEVLSTGRFIERELALAE